MQANLSLDHEKQEACLVFCLDARGLIRWMLMVNPERRATVEDIANHWGCNWGWKTSVCDCESQRDAGSPMLARLIDWQNRTEPRPTKPSGLSHSCLSVNGPKKSKIENDVGVSHVMERTAWASRGQRASVKTRTSEEQTLSKSGRNRIQCGNPRERIWAWRWRGRGGTGANRQLSYHGLYPSNEGNPKKQPTTGIRVLFFPRAQRVLWPARWQYYTSCCQLTTKASGC